MAHSLRIGFKFLRATNRVEIRDDDLVNFDFFLLALRSIEGRENPQIDAYKAAAADPFLKIIKQLQLSVSLRTTIQKISLWLTSCGIK